MMDHAKARELLDRERARLAELLAARRRELPPDQGDEVDTADWRVAEETGNAIDRMLRDRWAALERAEARLAGGTYGRSVRSGAPIPDERLEADPLVELTVEEAARDRVAEPSDADAAIGSPRHPFEVLNDARTTPEERLASEADEDEPTDRPRGEIHTRPSVDDG